MTLPPLGLDPRARPAELEHAVRARFDEQCVASTQQRPARPTSRPPAPAYTLWGDAWDGDEADGRFRPAALLDASEVLRALVARRGTTMRVLDIGCGDSAFLVDAHERLGLPWSQLLGVGAEDERARGADGATLLPDSSFALFNAEALDGPLFAPESRHGRFDLIVSWSTSWHLVDPLGSLCAALDILASPGGVLLIHGVPFSHTAPGESAADAAGGAAADLALAAAVQAELRLAGERVCLVVQHESVTPTWIRRLCVTWLQCKRPDIRTVPEADGLVPAPITVASAGSPAVGPVLPFRYVGGLVRGADGERARYAPASAPHEVAAWHAPGDAQLYQARREAEEDHGGSAGDGGGRLLSTAGVRGVSAAEAAARLRTVYEPWLFP
ncbi:hypothetical protein T492DRAFT_981182 [Pavlovales sp. CCMP2436]|nr:hypothetical protein T492DRAFT_981182 [Pavlovales sp. CCMP2436]